MLILGETLDEATWKALQGFIGGDEFSEEGVARRLRLALGLMVASPGFQWM
jgi:hypothetical protein